MNAKLMRNIKQIKNVFSQLKILFTRKKMKFKKNHRLPQLKLNEMKKKME